MPCYRGRDGEDVGAGTKRNQLEAGPSFSHVELGPSLCLSVDSCQTRKPAAEGDKPLITVAVLCPGVEMANYGRDGLGPEL